MYTAYSSVDERIRDKYRCYACILTIVQAAKSTYHKMCIAAATKNECHGLNQL